MSKLNRRRFLRWVGVAAFAGAAPWRMLRARSMQRPKGGFDLAVINGKVYTLDEEQPIVEAFVVQGNRFVAAGKNDDMRTLIGSRTRVIDAAGMTVTPGFIDAHSHPGGLAEVYGVDVGFRTIAEIKQALRQKAKVTPAEHWVDGYMYDDTKLRDGRPLNRTDLDDAVSDRPVMVHHRGGHTFVLNSKAFQMAGVTAQTPDPQGGRFYRDNGMLTGKVAEGARAAFNGVGKRIPVTREARREGVRRISAKMSAAGLTSVTNAFGSRDDLIAYQDARAANELNFRVYFMPGGRGRVFAALKEAALRTGFGDEWIRIGAVKFVADGSASERTMSMSTPYVGRPNDYGILTMSQREIDAAVEDAHRAGFQVGIHANGDVAIDRVLKAYERVQEKWPRPDPRHRIEHCSLVNPDLLRRIKSVGAIPAPFYTYAHYHGNKWVEYGAEKMRWMFAHKSFLDYGIPVAPASDYPPGPFQPMMAIQSLVTRKDFKGRVWGPNQRISVADALRICTLNGAYASFEEHLKGSITPGKLADFVFLAKDPHKVDPDTIKHIPVIRTVIGGKTIHKA